MAEMAKKAITRNLAQVLIRKSRPGITLWNRLEGRPRADNFGRALRAEVRDPLWMLTRQWQVGEFMGDDAGSPILSKVHVETTRLRKYQAAGGPVEEFDDGTPLEARVETMAIPFTLADHEISLDIRLAMGHQWTKMISSLSAAAVGEYIAKYPIHLPDPTQPGDALTCAHPEAWSNFMAVSGRKMDGAKLYAYLKENPVTHAAADGIPALLGLEAEANLRGRRFVDWFEKLFYQPSQASAWIPERLEYQFACSSPQSNDEKVLVADEYFHSHLDWYNFDVDQSRASLGDPPPTPEPPDPHTLSMLPTQVTFNGMPNSRWWTFEDGTTNFGDIKPDTTDLAKLLLIEFGLIYANDWYMVPFTLPAGSLARVKGIAVTNVFGERTWIRAAGAGQDEDWQRWAMFLLNIKGESDVVADLSLLVPPAAQKVLEGAPMERLAIVRDEMANMVWAIEKTIPLPSGEPRNGKEAAYEMRDFFERRVVAPAPPPTPAEGAKIRYEVMSSVPENWIPMLPVHVAGDTRQIQLQRGAMLRVVAGAPPASRVPVEPRTSLLRPGLDLESGQPYFVHEQEVTRAGVDVSLRFQRTRWRDGRAWTWLGAQKETGRGEGSSGLAFDRIVDIPPE